MFILLEVNSFRVWNQAQEQWIQPQVSQIGLPEQLVDYARRSIPQQSQGLASFAQDLVSEYASAYHLRIAWGQPERLFRLQIRSRFVAQAG
jgi:hypothetical protein